MKALSIQFAFILSFFLICQETAQGGPIPAAFVQNEKAEAADGACHELKLRHFKISEKISELQREQEKYLTELEQMEKTYCGDVGQ